MPRLVRRQARIGATLAALDDKIRAHTDIARTTRLYREALADALLNGILPVEPGSAAFE
jgi:type I restriction enzyme S subunit